MGFKPLGNRVLIQRVDEEEKTASGIIIPDQAKEKPLEGVVKAISKEVEKEGEVAVDDKVVFAKYSGNEVSVDGDEYLVMSIDDILGVIKS
jgi:chaperonin GroES